MNNFIEYFYGIKFNDGKYENNTLSFFHNGYLYKLYVYDEVINIKHLLEINKRMLENTLVNEIIINKDNEIISYFNETSYILMRIFANINKSITLSEIVSLSNSLYTDKLEVNWGILWERKIDYLENLINENGKKYPLIVDSFNYFVGLAENAISYFYGIILDKNYQYSVSHRKIKLNDTIESLYNPLNIIFDYKVRDVAEYIKISFFKNKDISLELNNYLINNQISYMEASLLVARLLYPSFYFDMYEDIMINEKEEKIIINILSKLDEYEKYLSKIITILNTKYHVDEISWLKNNI